MPSLLKKLHIYYENIDGQENSCKRILSLTSLHSATKYTNELQKSSQDADPGLKRCCVDQSYFTNERLLHLKSENCSCMTELNVRLGLNSTIVSNNQLLHHKKNSISATEVVVI